MTVSHMAHYVLELFSFISFALASVECLHHPS
ncbi:hypothetical protein FOFC_20917 [Fusarium oxysporum]|nr:hypothetical protein FOFC_20917 [Fusarium oxysporum]